IAHEFRTAVRKPGYQFIEIVDPKHDAQVTQGVYWGGPVIGNGLRSYEARNFKPTVSIGSNHHSDLYRLIPEPRHSSRPFALDHRTLLKPEPNLGKECNSVIERLYNDAHVVHFQQLAFS